MNELLEFSNEFEIRKIANELSKLMYRNESLSKNEKIKRISELFVEYGNLMSLTKEELEQEIHEAFKPITEKDILKILKEKYE